ncbi:MAG: ribosome maturation factor RimP [Candidatus Aphodocola sp.]
MDTKVRSLIEKPLNEINIKLCDVEYVKEGSMYFLRVVIDKEPFVDIDTCVLATEVINPLIDTLEDEFDEAYVLDVCSLEKGDK